VSPDGAWFDLRNVNSWDQYALAAKSLMKALELDDPEESLFVQLTISELSITTFALFVLARIFPEFSPAADSLCTKLTELSDAQQFLHRGGDE
jgi:hypothetical protein